MRLGFRANGPVTGTGSTRPSAPNPRRGVPPPPRPHPSVICMTMVSLTARTVNGVLTSPLTGGKAGRSALATAAGPAAGRYARHRATVRWRGGGGRHEAIWSDRGARRAAGPVRRGGDGRPGPCPGPKWQFLPAEPFTLDASFCGFEVGVTFPVNKGFVKILKVSDGSMTFLSTGSLRVSLANPGNRKDHRRERVGAREIHRA